MVFGDKVVKTQLLTIPHPRLHLRRFCLEPLSEILPLMKIPGINQSISELLSKCNDKGKVTKIHDQI